ncbi:MAG TPA: outer membrane lipoprotein carrier protein LolA [Reyranella sp.]|nr:outer membrane lipoprotein carrier protein LolA [Reyranella sp.]
MRAFLAVLVAVFSITGFAWAQGAPAGQLPEVTQAETYINSIRTAQARFVQNNPNGSIAQGTIYLSRPGKMRFVYDPPSQLKIVADGTQVTLWDPATRDFGQWPIGWTAATFLVRQPLRLSGDLTVTKVERVNGLLQYTIVQTRKPQEGTIIVRLSENPMELKGWSIIDGRGNKVDVALTHLQTGLQLADSLFKYDGPDAGEIMHGGNRQ